MALRLRKIDIQGFRAFGTSRQSIALPDTVAALWGGNSQGKTSLAEALEFLLTGEIARRELLASAKDEFSQSLRNAHLPPSAVVFVEAEFSCADGQCRKLRRTLTADYDGNTACQTALELDGAACTEADIEAVIGLKLLHPPLRAPVLAQHTLGYVFSASPTDRAAYFRAVLDIQDIEDFRGAVAALPGALEVPAPSELRDLAAVAAIEGLAADAVRIEAAGDAAGCIAALYAALGSLLTSAGETPAQTREERIAQLARALEARRELAFPLGLFARKALAGWADPSAPLDEKIATFETERELVEAETRRLVNLFENALAIPAIAECDTPIDCPVCGTEAALTPERVAHLRDQVAVNKAYQAAEKALQDEVRTIDAKLQALAEASVQALPKFAQMNGADRRKEGFRTDRVRALSGDAGATAAWLAATKSIWRKTTELRGIAHGARQTAARILAHVGESNELGRLKTEIAALHHAQQRLEQAHAAYTAASNAVGTLVKAAADQSAQTNGWEQLGRLSGDPSTLLRALEQRRVHQAKMAALDQALRQIDAANGRVADEKFADLSAEVAAWWERLRPGEPTFFSAVRRRSAKARRTIDLKVALSAAEDRSNPKLRDAVAVFSQSQLHCLGVSLFLARAIDSGAGFVLLDDPVLTSDDDFRPNFASTVIEALLDAGVQIIVVTQDHASWKDIGHRWGHRGAAQFQMVRDHPLIGTEIRSQNDALATLLAQAQPFISSHDGQQRKEGATRLRQAIERFCKEVLVRSRQAKGDQFAMITDYDGQNFGNFSASVHALLTKDPSHPGKLIAAHNYVTPGPHDDTPPSTAQLKMASGDLKHLKKTYLDS